VNDDRYQTALKAVRDEVLKLIARHDAPPDVQRRLNTIELICRNGMDIRTPEERGEVPEEGDNDETLTDARAVTTAQEWIKREARPDNRRRD
jgi:hypothetical protein